MILVTSYLNADLDGVSSAYAYAEYLRKTGEEAEAAIFGDMHVEARYVVNLIEAEVKEIDDFQEKFDRVVLVDDSRLGGLPKQINPEEVTEIIDHREIDELKEFPNAEIQIEKVGAAATLIAERFRSNNIPISDNAAVLLYGGIASNTMNFQANVTTERDRDMARWLEEQTEIPENMVREMFMEKSQIEGDLKEVLLGDWKEVGMKGKTIGIAQLEIVDIEQFVRKNKTEIEDALNEINSEKDLDYIYLTMADLEQGYNILISTDEDTKRVLSKALDIEFSGINARKQDMLLRKEINPRLEEYL